MSDTEQTYFQKGFNLKAVVRPGAGPELPQRGRGPAKELGYAARAGELTPEAGPRVRLLLRRRPRGRVRLRDARAVPGPPHLPLRRDHPQPGRERPHRGAWASASCPRPQDPADALRARSSAADVVILPAFGVPVAEMEHLRGKGCVLVDTTCGSVLNVWKNVHKLRARRLHRRDPRQALPRGDEGHRLAGPDPPGRPLPVRARPRRGRASSATSSAARVGARRRRSSASPTATSPGFDPERDLAADRPRQPDHDADEREPGDPGDAARGDARALRRGRAAARASAPSTRSARPPRTARTRCCRCSTRAAST